MGRTFTLSYGLKKKSINKRCIFKISIETFIKNNGIHKI